MTDMIEVHTIWCIDPADPDRVPWADSAWDAEVINASPVEWKDKQVEAANGGILTRIVITQVDRDAVRKAFEPVRLDEASSATGEPATGPDAVALPRQQG